MLVKVAWSIVADGTLFKGAFVVIADDEEHAIERCRSALGREGNAANFTVKATADNCLELGRSEYPSDNSPSSFIPRVATPSSFLQRDRFVFDVATRANVIAEDEEQAFRKLGLKLSGKDVGSVKYVRTAVTDCEPLDSLSTYERHLLEKQFRGIRVAST